MKHFGAIAGVLTCILLSACTDYATFVTATDIGINLDAKTEQLNIGYSRAELFHGPGYPEKGSAPSAVAYISSDLAVFSPNVKQLYATGDAAELVTRHDSSFKGEEKTIAEKSDKLDGHRRPLFFGTGTNLGLKVGFTGDVPSSVKFGFNREELSIIPMQRTDPSAQQPDKYASVLASINTDNTVTNTSGTAIRPTQFFATGAAARNLAKRDEIRGYFGAQAEAAIAAASFTGDYSYDDSSKKLEALWIQAGKINEINQTKIHDCMTVNNIGGRISFLINSRTQKERDAVLSCVSRS